MFNQATARRDAFTFSLGGMATIASVVVAPAVAHDRLNKDQLNKVRDDRMTSVCEHSEQQSDQWLSCNPQAA